MYVADKISSSSSWTCSGLSYPDLSMDYSIIDIPEVSFLETCRRCSSFMKKKVTSLDKHWWICWTLNVFSSSFRITSWLLILVYRLKNQQTFFESVDFISSFFPFFSIYFHSWDTRFIRLKKWKNWKNISIRMTKYRWPRHETRV